NTCPCEALCSGAPFPLYLAQVPSLKSIDRKDDSSGHREGRINWRYCLQNSFRRRRQANK
ncbi:hypothetical protein WUBG_10627, partial [Wuchereria bancrofti]